MGKRHAAPQAHGTKAINPIVPAQHRICLQIVDDQGKPLKGIEVRLEHAGKERVETTTEKGVILLTHLRAGAFKVLAIDGEPIYEFVIHQVKPIPPSRPPKKSK